MPQSDRQEKAATAVTASLEARVQEPTAKGDIGVYDGSDVRNLAVGADDSLLTADSTSLYGVAWNRREYLSVYDTTGGVSVASTATVVFDTTFKNSNSAVFDLTSGIVTVSKTGTFMFNFDVTIEHGAGGTRGIVEIWVEEDDGGGYVEITGSRASVYPRTTGGYHVTGSSNFIIDVTSGDKFRIRAVTTIGLDGNEVTQADQSRLTILEV